MLLGYYFLLSSKGFSAYSSSSSWLGFLAVGAGSGDCVGSNETGRLGSRPGTEVGGEDEGTTDIVRSLFIYAMEKTYQSRAKEWHRIHVRPPAWLVLEGC